MNSNNLPQEGDPGYHLADAIAEMRSEELSQGRHYVDDLTDMTFATLAKPGQVGLYETIKSALWKAYEYGRDVSISAKEPTI